MADYKVTIEEDKGSFGFEIIIAAIIIAVLIFAAVYIGIPALIIYVIYRIVKYNKKVKSLQHTKCPKCNKLNALKTQKEEVIKENQITKPIYNKESKKQEDAIFTEITTRKYEKCIFCNEITYTDISTIKI